MNFAQITIYDIVGYFIPGVFGSFGIYLLACPWVVTLEQNWKQMTLVKWLLASLCAYVLGHCMQGVANWIEARRGWPRKKANRKSTTADVLGACSQQYAAVTAWVCHTLGVVDVAPGVLYEIMDAHVIQKGKTETRDVYVYREGFYRGLYVAFTLIVVGSVVRLCDGTTYTLFGGRVDIINRVLWTVAIASGIAAVLCYYRFRRFEAYRVRFALMSFVALTAAGPQTPSHGNSNDEK